MRKQIVAALAAIAACTGLASPHPATADGWHARAPAGYVVDLYAYSYEPRRYYPYYNSGHWRPAAEVRLRRKYRYKLVHPPYYQAWGYPNRYYIKRSWHRR